MLGSKATLRYDRSRCSKVLTAMGSHTAPLIINRCRPERHRWLPRAHGNAPRPSPIPLDHTRRVGRCVLTTLRRYCSPSAITAHPVPISFVRHNFTESRAPELPQPASIALRRTTDPTAAQRHSHTPPHLPLLQHLFSRLQKTRFDQGKAQSWAPCEALGAVDRRRSIWAKVQARGDGAGQG